MWKTPFLLTAAITFYPQASVKKITLFHRYVSLFFAVRFSTGYPSTFHSPCGKRDMRYELQETR